MCTLLFCPNNVILTTVNNVGYGGDLLKRNVNKWDHVMYDKERFADDICERKKLVQADSIRNILAMYYVVEQCAESGVLADGARVINIAGIGVAPSTAVDGRPLGDHYFKFMKFWQHKVYYHGSRTFLISGLFSFWQYHMLRYAS